MDKLWDWIKRAEKQLDDQTNEPEYSDCFTEGYSQGWKEGREFGELSAYESLSEIIEEKHRDQLHRLNKNQRGR